MTRVTNGMMVNNFMKNYKNSSNNLNKYYNQLATGKKFRNISENPLDASKSLRLKTILKFNERYKSNAESGIKWLENTDAALNDVNKTLRKARDLAVKGSNSGTMTPDDRDKLKQEVDQLREHLVQIGNSTYGDKYIFNGSKTTLKPYEDYDSATEDGLNQGHYLANGAISTDAMNREVSQSIQVDINVSGTDVGDGGFSQIFADLNQLSQALNDGAGNSNETEIQNSIDRLDGHIENVLAVRGRVGARQQRLELTSERIESQEINYTKVLSETEDVDIPETIMKLKNQENVHRAALSTGARIIQPTLMDFLR